MIVLELTSIHYDMPVFIAAQSVHVTDNTSRPFDKHNAWHTIGCTVADGINTSHVRESYDYVVAAIRKQLEGK